MAMPILRLRTTDAAAYVGLSVSTLEKLRLYGGGPVFYKSGPKIVLYETPNLDDWLHARRCTSTSDRPPALSRSAGACADR